MITYSQIQPQQEDIRPAFSILQSLLNDRPLPAEGGGMVMCNASDFQLMSIHNSRESEWDGVHVGRYKRFSFKNVVTRNYLVALWSYLHPATLLIPATGEPFARGTYDTTSEDVDAIEIEYTHEPSHTR